ncbi:MAG: S8 family serine peptidase [Candidatus Lokiarchaeota archaeon]|nr:S8 family serine peptidase [Candidatus Lokiarchaeota archaeon]
MFNYWDYDQPAVHSSSSSGKKIAAGLIIVMLVLSTGIVIMLGLFDGFQFGAESEVRVAVLDTGIDPDFTLQNSIVVEKSFINPENGYSYTDVTTEDSKPDGNPHGTLVAKAVLEEFAGAKIMNGKIMDNEGTATTLGVIAGIEWAVEQNCSVINLSLGASPSFNDSLEDVISWAFDRGVVVVASGGNEGDDGFAGTSISSPSVFEKCISVAALDSDGTPTSFTSHGPTSKLYMKPDIATLGYIQSGSYRYYGTSFAAPRVAGGVVEMIDFCLDNNISYTPGMIVAALLQGAEPLNYEEYIVGAGRMNIARSIELISENTDGEEVPSIAYAHPSYLPIDYERLFYGDRYRFKIHLFCGGAGIFDVNIASSTPEIFDMPDTIYINQSGFVDLEINVPTTGSNSFDAEFAFFSDDLGNATLSIEFTVVTPNARVAFDITHSTWSIDTKYGQFREFYKELVSNSISVEQISNRSEITESNFARYDAIIMLDPCTWDVDDSFSTDRFVFSKNFTTAEIDVYQNYYENGGGLFIAALSNKSVDIASLNEFLTWAGLELASDVVPSLDGTVVVSNLASDPIMDGVSSFDFAGAPFSASGTGTAKKLATIQSRAVMVSNTHVSGGRMVVTGTNFFIDNWGMLNQYGSQDNAVLALQIVQWITGLI